MVTVGDTAIRKLDTSEIVMLETVTMVADMTIAIADMKTTIAVIGTQAATTTIIMSAIPEAVADHHLVPTTIVIPGMMVCVL